MMMMRAFACVFVFSASQALASAPPPIVHPSPMPISVDAVIAEIKREEAWRDRLQTPTPEFRESVIKNFSRWQDVLTRLSGERRQADADRIVAALIHLRSAWGERLVPAQQYDAFLRDRFLVGTRHVDAAQFFEPTPYYPGDRTILKLLRFSVYEGERVVVRYYLEQSDLAGKYNVLTCKTADGKHRQVQPYGATLPTYWELKQRVIADLSKLRRAK